MVCTWHFQRNYTTTWAYKLSATCTACIWAFMDIRFRVVFFFFFLFSVKVPKSVGTLWWVAGAQFNIIRHLFTGSTPLGSWAGEPTVQEYILDLRGGISSAVSYFLNYQRRGPLYSIVGAMVSHVGHINTGEQASVTHSWVCSSPKAPARPMPTQTTLPIPHLNHTGFLQEPGAEIQFWKWRFRVLSIHMMVQYWEEYCQRDWLFFSLPFHTKWINHKEVV